MSRNLLFVAIALLAFVALASFGCIEQLQQYAGGMANATGGGTETDTFGSQLEALNGDIYAAKDQATIAVLSARVAAMESQATTNADYQKYLPMIQAQSRALMLANATLVYVQEGDAIAKNGIDCSRDYSALVSSLKSMNYTKQVALQKAESYLASNPTSSVRLLVQLINSTDTEGMYLLSTIVDDLKAYQCLKTEKPAKTYTTPLTKDDAVSLVVDEVVGADTYFVYYPGKQLAAGTIVSVEDSFGGVTNHTLKSATWFFMLDKSPSASWSHEVKFVFVDAATAEYSVSDEMSYPVIDGISYWLSMESRLDPRWVVYPANPQLNVSVSMEPSFRMFQDGKLYFYALGTIASVAAGTDCSKINCCQGVGKDKALIVSGNDQDLFHNDAQGVYDFLKAGRHIPADDITYLTAKNGIAEGDGRTNLNSFKAAVDALARSTECCDRIFIYMTGHGNNVTMYKFKNKDTGEERYFAPSLIPGLDRTKWEFQRLKANFHHIDLNPPSTEAMPDGTTVARGDPAGGFMWAWQIGVELDKLKSCYVTLLYDSCHSGPAGPWLAGRGRTIMTTSNSGSAWGLDGHGVFNTQWIYAHGLYADEADANNDGTVNDREAYDYANRETQDIMKKRGKGQSGTWTDPAPPCTCCDVVCNETTKYTCIVTEGNGTIDPKCKKVGDYCGPTVTPPTENGTTGGGEQPPQTAGVCGDGVKVAPEECEKDADCPKYRYCDTKTCACKQYPLLCGDGHIAAGEECDPKATPTGCMEGKICDNCRCTEPSSICGDGQVSGLEQCDSGKPCSQTGMSCNMNTCQCVQSNATGGGEQPPGGGTTEPYCGDGTVNSNEQCEQSSQCSSGYYCSGCRCIQTPARCGDGQINGNEQCDGSNSGCSSGGVCSSGCACVYPPSLNCGQICGYTQGAQAFQGTFTSESQCGNAVKSYFGTRTCYTTCYYSYLYQVTNIAGTASCCCGMKKDFACSNCPCQGIGCQPSCPGQDTCQQNAPSWYQPPD